MSWLRDPMGRLRRRAEREGPAEVFALLRVGLVLLVWTEWGRDLQLFRDLTPHGLALSLTFWTSTTLLFLGAFSRVASAATALLMLWMYFGEGHHLGRHDWVHHHSWVIMSTTALLAFAPVERWWSVDAWRAVRAGRPLAREAPCWVLDLIGFQLSNVYFWGAWDKTYPGFLSGARLQHHFHALFWGSDAPGAWFGPTMLVLAVLTVALEYALAIAPWIARVRTPALLAGVALHASFYLLLPVGTFSAAMVLLYLAWLPPEDVRAFLRGDRPLPSVPP